MQYTLFIDESGNISKTNNERYFCIGGYLVKNNDRKHMYKMKKIQKKIREDADKYINFRARKKHRNYDDIEIKFSNLNIDGKNFVYNELKKLDGEFVCIMVDKETCTSLTGHSQNDYYNYLVKILIGYIFETRNYHGDLKFKELKVIFDNRSMKIEANNDLQEYLLNEFKSKRFSNKYSCNFNIREADSKLNYGVMVADFISGLCWARYNFSEGKYGKDFTVKYLSKFPYKDFGKENSEEKVLTMF